MAQLNGREEKFDSYLNKTIIFSSRTYFKKQMNIRVKERTIVDDEDYSSFIQDFMTLNNTSTSIKDIDTSLQLKNALE